MAGKLLALRAVKVLNPKINPFAVAQMSNHAKELIGKREIVGFGFNGQPGYVDRDDFPLPAIRWKEPSADIQALREKEKGDWKNLTIEEKKALYRYSFCQTFAEFNAPSGEWKSTVGLSLVLVSIGIWAYYGLKAFGKILFNYSWSILIC